MQSGLISPNVHIPFTCTPLEIFSHLQLTADYNEKNKDIHEYAYRLRVQEKHYGVI